MNGPDANSLPLVPAEGEKLHVSGVDQWTNDERTITALKRLAEAKAPQTIAQMVLWNVAAGADWDDIGRLSQGWGNAGELALAHRFVANMNGQSNEGNTGSTHPKADPGLLCWEIKAEGAGQQVVIDGVRKLWTKYSVLGLTTREGVPEQPEVPALACRAELTDSAIHVKLCGSHPSGSDWILIDRFELKRSSLDAARVQAVRAADDSSGQEGQTNAARLADAIAEAMAARLVRVTLAKGPRVHGKETFRIKIINDSPLILNGLAVDGSKTGADHEPSVLAGLSIPPQKTFTLPASPDAVKRLRLKDGARVVAADLSGL
jgi:hypothetical protein